MDSANLSESQSTPLSFKSTASNTSPVVPCACCSLKQLAQTLPQAYCFRGSNPGQSKCKNAQDAEEKFPMQQQFFSSFPLFTPFFYNSSVTNLCCPHNPTTNEQQKQAANDTEKIPENLYPQKEKCSYRMNPPAMEEDPQKNNFTLGPGVQFMGPPFCFVNPQDSQFNCLYQRCGCGDSLPWPCSSFIVPVIGYCLFWNTRKPNMNILTGFSQETLCNKNKENEQKSELDIQFKNLNVVKDFNNNSTDINSFEDCLGGNSVTKNEWENEDNLVEQTDQSLNSFRSVTCISSNFAVDNSFKNAEGPEVIVRHSESGSEGGGTAEVSGEEEDEDEEEEEEGEDDEEDTETCYSDDLGKNNECTTEKDTASLDLETREYLKGIESQLPSAAESYSDLKKSAKTGASGAESSSSESEINPSEISAEEKNDRKGKNQKTGTQCREANSIKKFINNFTMTDQTRRVHEEGQAAAAAGDLGGINCVGYKVNIPEFEDDRRYKILNETQIEENFQSKEFFLKGLPNPEERKDGYLAKNREKTPKPIRNFKSGIAKLLNNSKLKEAKGDAAKNLKNDTKELSPREPVAIKRKHNCFPTETASGPIDNISKTQKTRNCKSVQPQIQVPEKQHKTTHSKSETIRRGEKFIKGKQVKDGAKK